MGTVVKFPLGETSHTHEIPAATQRGIEILAQALSEMMGEALGERFGLNISYEHRFILITP